VLRRLLVLPLGEEDDRDLLHRETFLNEPSTDNLENKIVLVLTAAILVKRGDEMKAWFLCWVHQPRVMKMFDQKTGNIVASTASNFFSIDGCMKHTMPQFG
jgi:hypothetical protein